VRRKTWVLTVASAAVDKSVRNTMSPYLDPLNTRLLSTHF